MKSKDEKTTAGNLAHSLMKSTVSQQKHVSIVTWAHLVPSCCTRFLPLNCPDGSTDIAQFTDSCRKWTYRREVDYSWASLCSNGAPFKIDCTNHITHKIIQTKHVRSNKVSVRGESRASGKKRNFRFRERTRSKVTIMWTREWKHGRGLLCLRSCVRRDRRLILELRCWPNVSRTETGTI